MNTGHFHELRSNLANARHELRAAKDSHATALAIATQRANVTGKNAEERAVNLTLALHADEAYRNALQYLRRLEYEVERIEALLESACDDRRATEWQIRGKLADALFRANVQTDHSDPTGDGAFDDSVDSYVSYPSRARAYETIPDEDLPF